MVTFEFEAKAKNCSYNLVRDVLIPKVIICHPMWVCLHTSVSCILVHTHREDQIPTKNFKYHAS